MTYSKLALQNPQWGGNPIHIPSHERDLCQILIKNLEDDLLILINGARRTGKSVILRQIMNYLLMDKKIPSENILFYEFSPEDTKETLESVFYTFREEVWDTQERAYIFLDEAQYVKGYESAVKLIYDLYKGGVKIFLTGSLSISYKRRMQESLAGRFLEYILYPLSYEEYLRFTNPTEYANYKNLKDTKTPLLLKGFAERMRPDFEKFLRYKRLPELAFYDDLEKCQMYLTIVKDQSLNQDALTYFGVGRPQVLIALFGYISKKTGLELSLKNTAQEVFFVDEATLTSYLDILELMGMVHIVRNTTNPLKALNSLRKAYVGSHFASLDTNIGYLVESYVLERLLSQRKVVTYYRKRDKEIDFLVPGDKEAYEIKYRSQIKTSELAFLEKFSTENFYKPFVVSLKDVSVEGGLGKGDSLSPDFIPAVFF
jgi:predicted AAA+ superfamily ATPase